MYTDPSGTPNQPSKSDQEQSQEGGPIGGMLKGKVSGVGDNLRNIVRGEVALAKES